MTDKTDTTKLHERVNPFDHTWMANGKINFRFTVSTCQLKECDLTTHTLTVSGKTIDHCFK